MSECKEWEGIIEAGWTETHQWERLSTQWAEKPKFASHKPSTDSGKYMKWFSSILICMATQN